MKRRRFLEAAIILPLIPKIPMYTAAENSSQVYAVLSAPYSTASILMVSEEDSCLFSEIPVQSNIRVNDGGRVYEKIRACRNYRKGESVFTGRPEEFVGLAAADIKAGNDGWVQIWGEFEERSY